jgi:hypothetical protein
MIVVLGFPRSDIWLEMEGDDNNLEDLRNRESNLGPEKVVETAIVVELTLELKLKLKLKLKEWRRRRRKGKMKMKCNLTLPPLRGCGC